MSWRSKKNFLDIKLVELSRDNEYCFNKTKVLYMKQIKENKKT